jgi:hypothetical protein
MPFCIKNKAFLCIASKLRGAETSYFGGKMHQFHGRCIFGGGGAKKYAPVHFLAERCKGYFARFHHSP